MDSPRLNQALVWHERRDFGEKNFVDTAKLPFTVTGEGKTRRCLAIRSPQSVTKGGNAHKRHYEKTNFERRFLPARSGNLGNLLANFTPEPTKFD
jgi:hypothetical protein